MRAVHNVDNTCIEANTYSAYSACLQKLVIAYAHPIFLKKCSYSVHQPEFLISLFNRKNT
jgi:hypothetical protein